MTFSLLHNCRVVITGAAGTVGQELIRQLVNIPITELRCLDNDESSLFLLEEKYRKESRVQVFLADVRDRDKLNYIFSGIDFVLHAAAYKHVPLCERSPFDAVQTNVIGVQNVIQASLRNRVKKVLFTSSDKAVNPTNVMGTTKLMGERLITAANALRQSDSAPYFASTRFGNVAGSSGSVIPLFCNQISQGGPILLTDSGMTRFIMTVGDAANLVLRSLILALGGEVFVTKMPVIRIADLAAVMTKLIAPLYGFKTDAIDITEIGARPGEKMYEELLNDEETRRAFETNDLFAVLPAFRNIYDDIKYVYEDMESKAVSRAYQSNNVESLGHDKIKSFLFRPGVLQEDIRSALVEKMKR